MTGIEVDDAGKVVKQMDMVDLTEAELVALVPQFDLGMSQRHEAALQKQVDDSKALTDKLSDDLTTLQTDLATSRIDRDLAKQELADIYDLLGADPKIAEIKKQQAIARIESEIASAIKRKDDLVNPRAIEVAEEIR